MERLSVLPLRICSSCFQLLSQSSSCMKCLGNRCLTSTTCRNYASKRADVSSFQPVAVSLTTKSTALHSSRLTSPSLPVKRSRVGLGGMVWTLFPEAGTSKGFHTLTSCKKIVTEEITAHHSLATYSRSSQTSVRFFSTSPTGPPLPPKKTSGGSMNSSTLLRNLLIVSGIGAILIYGMQIVKKEKERERQKTRNRIVGKARLGGDWDLIDHFGNKRSSTDFRGQWILIYFGFTNCPDICPEEIEKIISVIKKTDEDPSMPKIQPIVITVDPDRDTPEALKEYLGEFSPRLLGFTGSHEDISKATRAFRVYYSVGPKDEDNDYIVDHSIISYLMNPRGEFVEYFGQNKTADQIYQSMKYHIFRYLKDEKSS